MDPSQVTATAPAANTAHKRLQSEPYRAKRRSTRHIKGVTTYIRSYLLPEMPHIPDSERLRVEVNDLVLLREERRENVKRSRDLFDKECRELEYCGRRSTELEDFEDDLVRARREAGELRRRYASEVGDIALADMSPEQRELDVALTLQEDACHVMTTRLSHDKAEFNTLVDGSLGRIRTMRELTKHDAALEDSAQRKRAKLDHEMRSGAVGADHLERCVDALIQERIAQTKRECTALVEEQQRKLAPFLCPLCSDCVASATLPCCFHGICAGCMDRVVALSHADTVTCPFCRTCKSKRDVIRLHM